MPAISEPHVTELAHHFAQAAPVARVEKAVDYGVRAGQRAMAQLAWEEAVKHFDRARQLSDLQESRDEPQSTDLLLALGAAQIQAGADEEAQATLRQAIESARKLGGPDRLAEATLLFAIGAFGVNEVDDELIRLLEEALAGLDPGDSALRVRALSRLAVALYYVPGSHDRRKVLCGEAVDIARRLGDPMVLAGALGVRQRALWGPDNLDERLAELAECLRLAAANQDEGAHVLVPRLALVVVSQPASSRAMSLRADRQLTIFERLAQPGRDPLDQYMLMQLQSMRALMTGRYAEAEELATQALPDRAARPVHSGTAAAPRAQTRGVAPGAGTTRGGRGVLHRQSRAQSRRSPLALPSGLALRRGRVPHRGEQPDRRAGGPQLHRSAAG